MPSAHFEHPAGIVHLAAPWARHGGIAMRLLTIPAVSLLVAGACHDGASTSTSSVPPGIQLGVPFASGTPAVLAGRVPLAATCTTEHGTCRLEARLNGLVVASGVGSLDDTVSLNGQTPGTTHFVFTATAGGGATSTLESPSFVLRADTGWTYVWTVHGQVLDANERWAVVQHGDSANVVFLATGVVTVLNQGSERPAGWATATGGVIELPLHAYSEGIRVLDVGGRSSWYAVSTTVRGDWMTAELLQPYAILRRNLSRGTHVTSPPQQEPHLSVLSDDGTVTWVPTPPGPGQLQAILPDGSRAQLTADSAYSVFWGMKDGPLTLYERGTTRPAEMVLRTPGGEQVLSAPGDSVGDLYGPHGDLRDGWAGWTTHTGYTTHLWMRSPNGQVWRAEAGLPVHGWSLGWNGRVLVRTADRLYLVVPPYTTALDLGCDCSRPVYAWHDGHLYAYVANTIFRTGW